MLDLEQHRGERRQHERRHERDQREAARRLARPERIARPPRTLGRVISAESTTGAAI